jgi:hypothetical protein
MKGAERRFLPQKEDDRNHKQSNVLSVGVTSTYNHGANDETDDIYEISLRCSGIRFFSQDDCLNRAIWPTLFSHFCLPKFEQERHRFYMGLINTAEVKNANHAVLALQAAVSVRS